MKGIIIAGGFGTRLRPLTYNRPKHLLPVANRPFLEYQVALLKKHGIDEVVFATNYLADQIEAHFGDGAAFGIKMRFALEQEPLGTGGAIKNAAQGLAQEAVLVLNGDILTDFDLTEIIEFHARRRAAVTMALRSVRRPHAFGITRTDADGRITLWSEPSEEEKRRVAAGNGTPSDESDFINAGVYVIEPWVLEQMPGGRPVSIERETLPGLLADAAPLFGIAPSGFWMDIGRPDQYLTANRTVLSGQVRTDVPFCAVSAGARIDPAASLDAATSVGSGTAIASGASLSDCIIMQNVVIGSGAVLKGAIIEAGCIIGEDASVSPGTVLGAGSTVSRGSRI